MKIVFKSLFALMYIILFSINTNAQTEELDYDAAVILFNKANKEKLRYDFNPAEINFQKAANLFKKHNYWGNYIQSMYSLADIYVQKNKFYEAEAIFTEIDKIAIEEFGEESKFRINILLGKGNTSFYNGKANDALRFYKESLALNTKLTGGGDYIESQIYSSLGNTYSVVGEYDKAMDYYEKDLKLKEKIFGKESPEITIVYNNLAITYKNRGQFDLALEYVEKALKISIKAQGENSRTASFYGTKGNIYYEKGQYDLALGFIRKALKINIKAFGENHKTVADNRNAIGIILIKQSKLSAALISFKDALTIQKNVLGETHPDIAMTCNNIGFILQQQGKYESSLAFYKNAVEIKSQYYGNNHPDIAFYYNNIGINYYNQGMYSEAIQNYTNAQNILENKYSIKFPGLVKIYANKADIYRKTKNYNKSLEYYQKSLTANIKEFNPDTTDYFSNPIIRNYYDINKLLISLQGKAIVLSVMYSADSSIQNIENAYNTYLSCDTVIAIAGRMALKESDKIDLNNRTKVVYENAIITSIELAKLQKKDKDKQKYYNKAFYFSEKNKAGILSQAISASNAVKFAGIPDEIINTEKEYQLQISILEKLIAESNDNSKVEVYENLLFEYNNKIINLTKKIETEYPKYYSSKYETNVIDIKSIQQNLDNNSAFRSYFEAQNQIIIFTITKDEITIFPSEKPEDFNQKIKDILKYTTSGYKVDFPKYIKLAYELNNILFPDKLNKNIKNLTVVGDGYISLLPFDALFYEEYKGDVLNFKDYPFLIKKYNINYFYSANFFVNSFKKSNNKISNFYAIAPIFDNLEYSNINGFEVTPLPGSKEELSGIEKTLSLKNINFKSVFSKKATEISLKHEILKNYNIIHIATHGVVNTQNPELSGLILYPTDNNDDILYSGEIYNLELNADLVVLSACRTGIGQISKSEGIIGLPRALLYAGAQNVLVSLWKVSDASTANLMIDFYKNIIENNDSYTDALYKAKIKMIEGGGNFAHPFFWSPFVLIGK